MPRTEKGKMGLWMSTSLVVGNMIGSGIYLMPSTLAEYGGISILGWLISSAGALLLARVFSKLSAMVRSRSGGPYAYTRAAFGDLMGFLIAWGYWVSIWAGNAAIVIAMVSALSALFPALANSPLLSVLTGIGTLAFLTWINIRGVRSSGAMQVLTTILKIVPILLVILGGFYFFDSANFTPFNASAVSPMAAIATTVTMTLYAFIGIESATIPSDDIAEPEKTIPRATLLGTGFTTLIYILSTVVIMGMIPRHDLAASPAPFADAMGLMIGNWGYGLVAAGAAISAFGALNGWILLSGQIPKAAARDELFPKIFRRVNRKGVPAPGILIGSALTAGVMLMNYTEGLVEQFKFLILLSTLAMLVPYLFSAAAYVLLMIFHKLPSRVLLPVVLLGGGAFLFSLWGIYGSGQKAVFWGFLLLLAGIPFYVGIQWKKNK